MTGPAPFLASLVLFAAALPAQRAVRVGDLVDLRDVEPRALALPADLAFDPEDLARPLPAPRRAELDALLADCQRASKVHLVAAAVYLPGRGSWSFTCRADDEPAPTDGARFHAASVGKAMTAALVLQLVDEDRFALATTIDRWFPKVPNADRVTVDHLLAHTGGLLDPDAAGPDAAGPDADRRARSAVEVLAAVERSTPRFAPGERWAYCNAGYQLLGRIVELELEQPFAAALEQRVLAPLGLRDTRVVTAANQRQLLVGSHFRGGSGFDAIDYAAPLAAGPVASTPTDMVRWHCALLSGRALPPARAAAMLDRMWPMAPGTLWWGRGLMALELPAPLGTAIWSAGGIKGFGTGLAWIERKRAFVCVMVNDETPVGPFVFRIASAL
ncbi:MAG: serine hydrolase domain-containing protein [Planctomycetota bacterium]